MKRSIGSILILASVYFFSCSGSEEETISPETKAITESVYASGIVKTINQYDAYPMGSGPIQEVFVQEGDLVKEGDPILAIYSEREKLSRENAELAKTFADYQQNQSKLRDLQLSIDFARSKMNNDSLLYAKQKHLWDQNVGTQVELDQKKLNYENSLTAYESAQIRYDDLKREIEYNSKSASNNLAISKALESDYVLKSKIDGKVYALPKEKGEMVGPQTVVAVLGSNEEYLLELQVDEYDISKIELGQKAVISMDSYKGETFEGEITKIYPLMDNRSKTFKVEAKFTQAPTTLYPNLTLEANIITAIKDQALVIPRNYLFKDQFVITDGDDTVQVVVGIKNYQFAEIESGISASTILKKPNP